MANHYYYDNTPIKDDHGEVGVGLIFLFIFGVVNTFITSQFGSWGVFFQVIGLAALSLVVIMTPVYFYMRWYRKKEREYEEEQKKKQQNKDETK